MRLCLVIDDEQIAREVTVAMSREMGFTTAEADDGKQAAGFCMGKMPDIITLDIMMPNLNGVEFVKKLRSLPDGDKPYIIANSALFPNDEKVSEILASGANTFLPKPFGIDDLREKLSKGGFRTS